MDFSKLNVPKRTEKPIDPIKIFERLPNLPETPNDLWRGQAEALSEWNTHRNKKDILISLNTGAGKTLVGLLTAQSLVNEGVENVVYVCATIDLVRQTSKEAKCIGLDHTTRVESQFNNDLFESGKSFCITTYQALFNGFSAIRRRHFPGAVVFDDAHVAETIIRDSLTLNVSNFHHPDLFDAVAKLFQPHFKILRIEKRFKDSLTQEQDSIVMVAPGTLAEHHDRLLGLLEQYGIEDDDQLKYKFTSLHDKLDCCAMLFHRGSFELAPPFLPSLALDIFERPIRRIYLSATLRSKADIIRAFGRLPDVIEPDNDAGNGERLILLSRHISEQISLESVSTICVKHKVLIAVPSYHAAKKWNCLAVPPEPNEPKNFSNTLDSFRSNTNGAFILVSRVDGIDFPHDTCRIMVLDGLPSGTSLIERYQSEFLRMSQLQATRISNRLVQLFGRINRGRNDYGAFLITNKALNTWLNNERNVALLPKLLQKQILLGRIVQGGMNINSAETIVKAIDEVLSRKPSWLEYYGRHIQSGDLGIEQVIRAEDTKNQMVEAAKAEATYAAAMWNGDISKARQNLDVAAEATGRVDPLLSGWQSIWVGAALEAEGDASSAYLEYQRAMNKLGNMLVLPRYVGTQSTTTLKDSASPFACNINNLVNLQVNEKFQRELKRVCSQLTHLDNGSPQEREEAVRALGEILGFKAIRPDNDVGTGPDVLWLDDSLTGNCIVFELKTDKKATTYWKKDISQGHDHLSWLSNNHPNNTCLGLIYVGQGNNIETRGNPSSAMWCCTPACLSQLKDQLVSLINDLRCITPQERTKKTQEQCDNGSWTIEALFERLKGKKMCEMPRIQG